MAAAIPVVVTQRRVTAEVVEVAVAGQLAAGQLLRPVKAMTVAIVPAVVLAAVAVEQVQPVGQPQLVLAVTVEQDRVRAYRDRV